MFVERRINPSDGAVELWRCQWENHDGGSARKVYLSKICDEVAFSQNAEGGLSETAAICWSYGRTLGNIAVVSTSMLGHFPSKSGQDAILPCDFVHAGKFRHGAERLWCRTHQTHWGIKADLESYDKLGEMRCANHTQTMNYVVSPFTININQHAEVGIWCSMPAALSTAEIKPRPPKIHVHIRENVAESKKVDKDFSAISTLYSTKLGLFGNAEITRVNITPPAAFDYLRGVEFGRKMACINCSTCGYPHLDLGDFAETPHRKHFAEIVDVTARGVKNRLYQLRSSRFTMSSRKTYNTKNHDEQLIWMITLDVVTQFGRRRRRLFGLPRVHKNLGSTFMFTMERPV
jgi:hypothetical protein